MKIIIAGSRTIEDYQEVVKAVEGSGFAVSEIISGCAVGVDKLGERWAKERDIPIQRFPADWNRYGFSAGYMRNVVMGKEAEALVAVWDSKSKGTASMIRIMQMQKKPIHIHRVILDWF